MFFIFVTCFSFILFFRYSLPIKPLPSWAFEMRLLSFYFWNDFSKLFFPFSKLFFSTKKHNNYNNNNNTFSITKKNSSENKMMIIGEKKEQEEGMSVLDLPNLALECILERLDPDGLSMMSCVSTYLRDLCLTDHLWEPHMNKRWGRIISSAAYKQWELTKDHSNYFLPGCDKRSTGSLIGYFSKLWPVMLLRSSFNYYDDDCGHDNKMKMKISSYPSIDSIVSCYRALETGKFWFPAQVFNREVLLFLT